MFINRFSLMNKDVKLFSNVGAQIMKKKTLFVTLILFYRQ